MTTNKPEVVVVNEDKMRAEFEAWAGSKKFGLSKGHFKKDEDGVYLNFPTQCYWDVWQASRAALVVEQKPADRPEVVAWRWRKPIVNDHGETVGGVWELGGAPAFLPWWTNEPLVRLTEYEALKVECEKLVEPATRKLGITGAAFDPPSVRRAYTYSDQPDNATAWKLGRAACKERSGGDLIDYGLQMLQYLQDEGFGVFEIDEADPAPQPAEQPQLPLPDFITDPDDSDEGASLWDHGFKQGWNSCLEAVAEDMQHTEQLRRGNIR